MSSCTHVLSDIQASVRPHVLLSLLLGQGTHRLICSKVPSTHALLIQKSGPHCVVSGQDWKHLSSLDRQLACNVLQRRPQCLQPCTHTGKIS